MKNKIRVIAVLTVLVLMLTFSGCGPQKAEKTWYDFGAEFMCDYPGVVAENENFALQWNLDSASVSIIDKNTGKVYSNIPENAEEFTSHPQVYAPIYVGYIETDTLNTNNANAKTASVNNATFSSEIIENGIKVTYYFTDIAVSVPVNYILREDSLLVTVDPAEIGEDETLIYNISILPFFCSVNNTAEKKDNYLFVPSGSGALVYPKVIGSGITSIISEQVYGYDAQLNNYTDAYKEKISLPVYGAKNGESAVCAIIENSAETAEITTNIGSSSYGYSAVYSSFYIRGSEISNATYLSGWSSKKALFCEGKVEDEIRVGFYPLTEGKTDYSGMAECYRNYLVKNQGMIERQSDTLLNAEIIGGVLKKKFILGIPYNGLTVLTDFEDVNKISSELTEISDKNINLNLIGFGESGASIGKPAGNADYSSKFGSVKKLEDSDNLSLYFNFDLFRFSKSGSGINKMFGIARTAIGGRSSHNYQNVQYSEASGSDVYRYVRRSKLGGLADKVNKKIVKWNIDGVSLDTLTSQSYSDYYESKYYAKANTLTQANEIMDKFTEKNLKIAATEANAYAAVRADIIYDTPTRSSKYQVYDEDVPFYSMVFKGYIPMAVNAVNLSEDKDAAFLNAVETGMGLNYTLIANYDKDLVSAKDNVYFNSLYSDVKDNIKLDVDRYKTLFDRIANVKINKHYILENDVRATEYENGITVYVNYGETAAETPAGSVKAKDFLTVGG